jgi:hypothetical protein
VSVLQPGHCLSIAALATERPPNQHFCQMTSDASGLNIAAQKSREHDPRAEDRRIVLGASTWLLHKWFTARNSRRGQNVLSAASMNQWRLSTRCSLHSNALGRFQPPNGGRLPACSQGLLEPTLQFGSAACLIFEYCIVDESGVL